jgi:DNA-binding LytR/AlgR family response regulator
MTELSKKPSLLDDGIKHDLKVIFSISLGLFLFILFFQPFELSYLSFNNKLLFLTGLGAITFFIITLFQILLPQVWPKIFKTGIWESEPVYLISALIWIFLSTAFAFYLRYIGSVEITMYLMFKIIIICIAPVVVLRLYDNNELLRQRIHQLHENLTHINTQLGKNEKEPTTLNLELFSENKSEKIALQLNDLVLIRSADNYIEVVYKENDQFKKKLIRNTLKNMEDMLAYYTEFIRCHRTCIVNKDYIEKLNRNYTGQKIIILKGYDAEIPVSRQYQLLVKEALNNG